MFSYAIILLKSLYYISELYTQIEKNYKDDKILIVSLQTDLNMQNYLLKTIKGLMANQRSYS